MKEKMHSYQRLSRAAILVAVCVVLGFAFLLIPNVEMITAGIFLSGIWMGPRYGILIGFLAELIFSITNPVGFPPPPLLCAQIISMSFVGLTGGIVGKYLLRQRFFIVRGWINHLILGLTGVLLTGIYDFLTNLSFPLSIGADTEQIRFMLIAGIPLAIIHISVNACTFCFIIPAILMRFPSWRLT